MGVSSYAKRRVWVLLVTVLLTASALLVVPTRYALAANEGEMSLYSTASGAAVYLDMMLHSGNADKMETPESIKSGSGNVARISGALGYADLDAISEDTLPAAKDGEAGWTVSISSDNSKNASVYSYSAFANYGEVGKAIGAYGRYGHMLESLGIDSVVMGDGITNPLRPVIGGTLQGLFFIANGADQIMGGIVKAMQFTNPFRLFTDANGNVTHDVAQGADMSVTGSGWMPERADGTTTTTIADETFEEDDTTIFGLPGVTDAAELIFWIYRWLYALSAFVLIPLTVIITIAGYMIGRASFGSNSSLMPKVKRYVIRMAFLVGGIPLLAMAYTVTLDRLATSDLFDTTTGMGVYDMSDVVLHSFVDFGSWAENTNLAVPKVVDKNGNPVVDKDGNPVKLFKVDKDGNPTNEMYSDLNNIVYRINAAGHPGDAYLQHTLDSYYGMDRKDGDAEYDYQYGYWIKNLDGQSGAAGDVDAKRALISSLLSSYMKGEVLSGAEYEGLINTRVLGKGGKSSQELYQFLRACANPENYADGLATIPGKEGEDVKLEVHGILAGNSVNYTMSVKTQDQLSELYDELKKASDSGTNTDDLQKRIADVIQKDRDAHAAAGAPTEINLGEHYFGNGTLSSNGSGALSYSNSSDVGLSDVGMYNYLNTKFGTTGFTVYSGVKSVNTQSHPSHYRVNLVGGGVLGPLMAGNAALLLLAVGVTGIVYGLGMLFSSVKRSFSLIISLPMAFSGAIRSIAHVLLLGMALICEIFGTIFAYMLMKSLLISVNTFIANGKIAIWFTELLGGALGNAGGLIASIINYLIACVFLVLYIIMAIRLRLAISNALTDLVASWLSRLTDVNPGDATSSSSGFADAMVAGMAANPIGTVAGLGAMGMAGSAALTAIGRGGADEISLGGKVDSNGNVIASGGNGGDGADGGGNMLTGAYASSGGIEEVERKSPNVLGTVVGGGAVADASSSSDAYGASAHTGDVFGRDGASGKGIGIGGAAGTAGFGYDGADGKTGLASAFASGEGHGGKGGIGGDAGSGAIATGKAALGGAAVGGDAYGYGYGGDGSANVGGAQLQAAAFGADGGNATSVGASANAFGTGGAGGSGSGGAGGDGSANVGGAKLSAVAFGEGRGGEGGVGGSGSGGTGQGGTGQGGSARGVAVGGSGYGAGGDGSVNVGGASVAASAYGVGGSGHGTGGAGYGQGGNGTGGNAVGGDGSEGGAGGAGGSAAGTRNVAVGGAGVAYGGDGSANVGGASLSAVAFGQGGTGAGGAGGHGQGGHGQGGHGHGTGYGSGGAGGVGGEGDSGAGGAGGSAASTRNVAVGGAGVGYGGDGSANVGGATLSAAAFGQGGVGAGGAGGHGQGGYGQGGHGQGVGYGSGGAGGVGGEGGSGAGGEGGSARGVAVGGSGVTYGGDGSVNMVGSSSVANALAGEGGAGGRGGDARFRSAGAAYDRDLGGEGANVHVDAHADGLRQVQAASLASTIAGANALGGSGGSGGAGGAANPSDVRGVSANVNLGARAARSGNGTLVPNAKDSEHTTERIREVRGQGGTDGMALAGAVHASSAAIGSAHADHTSGGNVTSRGGVNVPERRRDVRGSDSVLGAAVGARGGTGAPGSAGRGGSAGAPGGAGGSGVGLSGAPGAAGRGGAGGLGGASMIGAHSGRGAAFGGLRGPRASTNTGSINVNVSSGGSGLASAAGSARGAHGSVMSGQGTAGSVGRGGVAGRGGHGGTSGASGRGGTAIGRGGSAGRSGQGGRAGSSARPNDVGVGASVAPYAGYGDRVGHTRAGSAERFNRAMNGGKNKPRSKGERRHVGTSLGDAVDHGTPAHGVDIGTLGNHDPLGRQ